MANIQSLGDSPSVSLAKIQETFPLPKSRKEMVTAFEHILSLGGVQRVVVEFGAPIKVTRLVKPPTESEEVPEELQDDDVMSAARNAEMEDFFIEGLVPTDYLLRAFFSLSGRKLKAKALLVNNLPALREWLGLAKGFDVSEVFGVGTVTHKEIPDGVLLLVASPVDDVDLVAFSLRLEMEKKS